MLTMGGTVVARVVWHWEKPQLPWPLGAGFCWGRFCGRICQSAFSDVQLYPAFPKAVCTDTECILHLRLYSPALTPGQGGLGNIISPGKIRSTWKRARRMHMLGTNLSDPNEIRDRIN